MPDASPDRPCPLRLGYVLKQYPRLSETFVMNEIIGLEAAGAEVSIFSLRHATEGRFHPGLAAVRAAVHYSSVIDKRTFLDAVRTVPGLEVDALPAALAFVDRLPEERRPRLLLNAIEIAGSARRQGLDHLHAHFLTVAAHTAHLVHLLTGIPYTVTAHAKDIYRQSVDWDIAGTVAAAASAVITVCDANLTFLTARLDSTETRIVRVYNGLGPQDPPAPLSARTAGLVLGVGRLVEKKGFDLLLDAAAKLAPRRPDLRVVIIGDGEERPALTERVSDLGIERLVTFTGPLGQHDVARWLRRASVLAAPCRVGADGNQDALPTVVLEALGAGLPVVSTPLAGIPEIVADGIEGLLVPVGDAAALATAVESLLDDPSRWRALSAAGPAKIADRFDRRATIQQLLGAIIGQSVRPGPDRELGPAATVGIGR